MSTTARHALFARLQGDVAALLDRYPLPELAGQRIFLTGASGFIGYWLLLAFNELHRRGQRVTVHALSRNPARFLSDFPECRDLPWLTWHTGDIKDYAWPDGPFDAMVHAATDTSPGAASQPQVLFDDIVQGSRRVLAHAHAAGRPRLLLLSSGAVYGEQPADLDRLPEGHACPSDPLAMAEGYGAGKRAMETLAAASAQEHGLAPIIARCFSFVGHRLPPHLAINQFTRAALAGEDIVLHSDGRPVRSYLYAADLTVWLLALLARGSPGRVYNVGSPDGISLLEAATLVRDTLAPERRIEVRGQATAGQRRRYVPDTRRIEAELGVACWTPLADALRKTAAAGQWLEQHQHRESPKG